MLLSKDNILLLCGLFHVCSCIPINNTGEVLSKAVKYEGGNDSKTLKSQFPYVETRNDNTKQRLAARDSVEIVLGAEDFANAARYAKKKVPEKAGEWKQAIKDKIVNRLADDKSSLQDGNRLTNADLLDLLDNGDLKIVGKGESEDMKEKNHRKDEGDSKKTQRTNIKANLKDLGVKDFEYQKPESDDHDTFED